MSELSDLVIVESPAKARTIGRILGKEYQILASMGHVRDLPDRSLGVDIANNFNPTYVENKDRGKVLSQLRAAAKKADNIYLAPDPDREGEAIAWHLKEILRKSTKAEFHRTSFHEITRAAVLRAFESPGDINMALVNSQQARRILDRLVGFQVSRLLWSRIERGISAGRVQSVALRMTCEREREINKFIPEEYWLLDVDLAPESLSPEQKFRARLEKINGEKAKISNGNDASSVVESIRGGDRFVIKDINTKPKMKRPSPPFITSTLQQSAGNLGFSANFTMRVAQQLYEGIDVDQQGPAGLITYMRTDSVSIANEARTACASFINSEFGPEYVPEKPNFYKSKASAQEAHEAIRPTDVTMTPDQLKPFLDESQYKLYNLIWKRFVASQMSPAQQQVTTVFVDTNGADNRCFTFKSEATVTTFPGYMKMFEKANKNREAKEDFSQVLGLLSKDMICRLLNIDSEQKFTEPPPRYSEATLIRALEANGIGRPSTYASIVNTIQNRKYVLKEKGKLIPTDLGFKVNDYLVDSLPDLFQIGFTAEMEVQLDKIEDGDLEWTTMMYEFYNHFDKWMDKAKFKDAPETSSAKYLIDLFRDFSAWDDPVKVGNRYYNDKNFYNSIRDKFDKDGKLSKKQWSALLRIAIKYNMPQLDIVAEQGNFRKDLDDVRKKLAEKAERKEANSVVNDPVNQEIYNTVFQKMDTLQWEEPEKGTGKGKNFNDKEFYSSLKQQVENGRKLSQKQHYVLGRIIAKYRDQIENVNQLFIQLGLDPEKFSAKKSENKQADQEEIQKMLTTLSQVQNWKPPEKKGRRTYDDKKFYLSLNKQVESGKSLSSRQIAALKKLVKSYSD